MSCVTGFAIFPSSIQPWFAWDKTHQPRQTSQAQASPCWCSNTHPRPGLGTIHWKLLETLGVLWSKLCQQQNP